MSCMRNWFSHSTSTSASFVLPGLSVNRPSTNAANTDMKGCSIWCPFCPLAASLYAFPCASAAANGWIEATSPSTSHVRQRNPSSRRLDWAAAGARLDDRSEVRCVRDYVPVSLLIDSPVFSRSQSPHLRYLESPLPSSVLQMRSQASARFWLSMTLFGLQRFHPCVFLPSDPCREHVSLFSAHCQPQKVSPWEHCWRNKTVQLLQPSLSGDQVETDGTR